MGLVMTPAFPASPSYALSAQGSEHPPHPHPRARHSLLEGEEALLPRAWAHPQRCVRSCPPCSDCWISVSACLMLSPSCVCCLSASGPLPPLLESLGVHPRPVIPRRLGLKVNSICICLPPGLFSHPALSTCSVSMPGRWPWLWLSPPSPPLPPLLRRALAPAAALRSVSGLCLSAVGSWPLSAWGHG